MRDWTSAQTRGILGDPYPRVSTVLRSFEPSGMFLHSCYRERDHMLELLDTLRPIEAVNTLRSALASKSYFSRMQKRWMVKPLEDGLLLDRLFPHVVQDPDISKSDLVALANDYCAAEKMKVADVALVVRDVRTAMPWIKEYGVELVAAHQVVVGNYGDRLGYAGEMDGVVIMRAIDDRPRVMDLKRTERYYRHFGLQLAAYFFADHVYDEKKGELLPINWDRNCPTPAMIVGVGGGHTAHRFLELSELEEAYDAFIGGLKAFLWNHVSPMPHNPRSRLFHNGKSVKYPDARPRQEFLSDDELDAFYEEGQTNEATEESSIS